MSFDYLNLFEPNDKNFLFQTEDKKYVYDGEAIFSFETDDKKVYYSSELGINDIKFQFAYGENKNYFMLLQKYNPIQEYKTSTEKNEYQYLYKKDDELRGDTITVENEGVVKYANDFKNCRNIHDRDST